MADCNDCFQRFLDEITVTKTQRTNLKTGRDAVNDRINTCFRDELKFTQPDFHLQGSYALKTMVKPIDTNQEYDLDDGVYLSNLDGDKSKWEDPTTVSKWIIKATDGHLDKDAIKKEKCIRLMYAAGYHIDLTIYAKYQSTYYLAVLNDNQWIASDARKFQNWFYDKLERSEQLRSCIKYLKAWKDFRGSDLKGIHITVLAGLNYQKHENRDDMSVVETVKQMLLYLQTRRALINPVDSAENLIRDWDDTKINRAIEGLKMFANKGADAVSESKLSKASKIWNKLFGDRFAIIADDKNESMSFSTFASSTAPVTPIRPWSEK